MTEAQYQAKLIKRYEANGWMVEKIGLSLDDVHALYERDGWTWYQPGNDYRIVFKYADGSWVRYYIRLHDDGVERVDGISNAYIP